MIKRKYVVFFVIKLVAIVLTMSTLSILVSNFIPNVLIGFSLIAFLIVFLVTVDWLKDTLVVTDQSAVVRSRKMGFFGESVQRVHLNMITEPVTSKRFWGMFLNVGWVELQTASDSDVMRYGPIYNPDEVIDYIDSLLREQTRHNSPTSPGNRIVLVPEDER